MSKIKEEWRAIKGYEGLYEVSDCGRVKNRYGKIIAQEKTKIGYLRVHLWKNGEGKHLSVHRLVAEAFIPNPDNKPCVGHIKKMDDGTEDKTANESWNLQWMTYEENRNYGTLNERISNTQINDTEKSKPINVYEYATGKYLYTFPSIAEAERQLAVCDGNIIKCINGGFFSKKRNKWVNVRHAKGYTFEYV